MFGARRTGSRTTLDGGGPANSVLTSPTVTMFQNQRMLDYLRRLAAWLRSAPGGPDGPPQDPYAPVFEPRRRTPGGRSSAIALAEPEPPSMGVAIGSDDGA